MITSIGNIFTSSNVWWQVFYSEKMLQSEMFEMIAYDFTLLFHCIYNTLVLGIKEMLGAVWLSRNSQLNHWHPAFRYLCSVVVTQIGGYFFVVVTPLQIIGDCPPTRARTTGTRLWWSLLDSNQ